MSGAESQNDARDLEVVKEIVLRKLAPYRVRVFLFGSRARGDAQGAADIDVGVEPLEPLPIGLLSGIREELEESRVPYRVDLVDISSAGGELREAIGREGVVWRT